MGGLAPAPGKEAHLPNACTEDRQGQEHVLRHSFLQEIVGHGRERATSVDDGGKGPFAEWEGKDED